MTRVHSKDGTPIAWERSGRGPALILVDGALCSRAFGPARKLAALLAEHFTVYIYDRRGRGESGDTRPYSPAREVDDLAALVDEAGGSAALLGLSSGGALALDHRLRELVRLDAEADSQALSFFWRRGELRVFPGVFREPYDAAHGEDARHVPLSQLRIDSSALAGEMS